MNVLIVTAVASINVLILKVHTCARAAMATNFCLTDILANKFKDVLATKAFANSNALKIQAVLMVTNVFVVAVSCSTSTCTAVMTLTNANHSLAQPVIAVSTLTVATFASYKTLSSLKKL